MTNKIMTVANLKEAIKNIPDDLPIYFDAGDDFVGCISIKIKQIPIFNHDLDDDVYTECALINKD
jgi:hypothetical protein